MIDASQMNGISKFYHVLQDKFSVATPNVVEHMANKRVLMILEATYKYFEEKFDEYTEDQERYYGSGKPLEVE